MQVKLFLFFIICFSLASLSNRALACFSITDDFNFPNPVLNAAFTIQPDVSPFTDCWTGAIRIRSDKNSWRLVANRNGPNPVSVSGDQSNNVKADDITLKLELKNFGMADPNGAVLVSPFPSQTDLSSIQSGTLIVSGIKRSGNSCSVNNQNFYKLTKTLCLFRDFVFNVGEYNGEVSYTLISP
ncbi:MAG: hypothetical protein HY094_06635 [Candidatus Melainabacteria bacterium]|nr:hypothetical protein [Candidatus Melainabacteria bacterium]